MQNETVRGILKYIKAFLKWVIFAGIIGFVGGVVGSVFHIAIDYVTELRVHNTWIVYLLPIGGAVIALIYGFFKKSGALSTNRVINALHGEEDIPFVLAPLIFVSATITHLVGGSAGREGAALQLGGSIGYRVGKIAKLSSDDVRTLVMTGMSAVFSALFGTPLTAAIFALEVSTVGLMKSSALFPCVISALVAYGLAGVFGIAPVRFAPVIAEGISPLFLLRITLLAILLALVSILFVNAISGCNKLGKKYIPNGYIRGLAGGAIILLLTLAEGTRDYNGAGMNIIEEALGGNARYEAFIIKILFTVITIAAGFKGGEIVPTFFIGSTFGCVASSLMGIEPALGAAIGFVALFGCVVNCPVASIFLAAEVFGGGSLGIFAYAVVISYFLSGKYSLYSSQKHHNLSLI